MSFLREDHPLSLVHQFCKAHGAIKHLEFSIYQYRPQTVEDRRRVVKIPVDCLDKRLEKLCKKLTPEEELAFHSRVYVRSLWRTRVFHLPLIDFIGVIGDNHLERCRKMLREFNCPSYALFSSGRSYHLYALMLMPAYDWVRFMGRLLLLNLPTEGEMVDTRWIGHRLLAGYSSLRWTRNTKSYKQSPRLSFHEPLYSDLHLNKIIGKDQAAAARKMLPAAMLNNPSSKPAT